MRAGMRLGAGVAGEVGVLRKDRTKSCEGRNHGDDLRPGNGPTAVEDDKSILPPEERIARVPGCRLIDVKHRKAMCSIWDLRCVEIPGEAIRQHRTHGLI